MKRVLLKYDENIQLLKRNVKFLVKWSVAALAIGVCAGFIGSSFGKIISYATAFWHTNPYALYMLPAIGIVILLFGKLMKRDISKGTNLVIDAISQENQMNIRMAPNIFVSTILTHIGAGSSGKEGAALLIGGSFASWFSDIFKFNEHDKKIAVLSGMSACFAGLFGTPLAAAIFSIEVINVGVMYHAALIPCILSAYIGFYMQRILVHDAEHFIVTDAPALDFQTIFLVVIMAALIALISILFCYMMHKSQELYAKYLVNPYIRILVGGVIFVILTKLVGNMDYSGSGMGLIEDSFHGIVRHEAFILKMLFTAIVLGAGYKGGEIVPALAVGASFGASFGFLTGFPPEISAACGMIACFTGVTNCPIASMFMAVELFGIQGIHYYPIAIAVCFTMSGYHSLYSAQKFAYHKTKIKHIDADGHKIKLLREEAIKNKDL